MADSVIAPLVIAETEDGSRLYLYEGAKVPSSVKDSEVRRLREMGMIGSEEELAEAQAEESPDLSANPNPPAEKPAGNASEAEWRAYAVSTGMSQEEADSKSRNELRTQLA